ncbi:hypothetical protein [Herminiimonas arsenitoxidans]|uniref:hypothetical protein n=1 Tax=Herminiimonas arsenitoxidans TaxID=1809410 RepID=UPI0009709055|nr:hypothetical protein [Herminiimonas arsenitoxidans]
MKIDEFIARQRKFFEAMDTGEDWDASSWRVDSWLDTRGIKSRSLPFTMLGKKDPLPQVFSDFTKAVLLSIYQLKRPKFAALFAYLIGIRRLFNELSTAGSIYPADLRGEHFLSAIEALKRDEYKNLYDAANCLALIGSVIDKHELTLFPIDFICQIQAPTPRLRHDPMMEREALSSKLPSREAMIAYAQCTNNPINEREEILLRTIDLHIAMGARINESMLVPVDCWIEKKLLDNQGLPIIDSVTKLALTECGIKYFPEKGFEPSIHWLADSDVPLARRAIKRLTVLTKRARSVACWQHENPGRLWDVDPQVLVSRSFINIYVETAAPYDVNRILDRLHVRIAREQTGNPEYLAGDVESAFLAERDSQVAFQKNGKVILRLHECLCIGFIGLFRLKGQTNSVNWLLPTLVKFADITGALGNTSAESIFDRRQLTEADGTRISLRTHQSRHWRNTLYKLGGMTEIQQALAMGRKDIKQNVYYQHVALDTELAFHSAFVEFQSYHEKVQYLQSGIVNGKIQGALAETYHHLNKQDPVLASDFLDTHAGGVHVTLWGICTNDFSREPCQKHLQCFDNCGHLHRTDDAREADNLRKLLELNMEVLTKMQSECVGEAGADKWIAEQERKIEGIRKAITLSDKIVGIPIKVFPEAAGITKSISTRRGSSV